MAKKNKDDSICLGRRTKNPTSLLRNGVSLLRNRTLAVKGYFLGLFSYFFKASSKRSRIASDLEFTRFSNLKSSSRLSRASLATKIIFGLSVGMNIKYHHETKEANKYVDTISDIGY